MAIGSDEVEIKGSWLMIDGRMTEDNVTRRIGLLVKSELQLISTSKDGWEKLFQDPKDERYWELTYPRSEMQGGGSPALICVSLERVRAKYGTP